MRGFSGNSTMGEKKANSGISLSAIIDRKVFKFFASKLQFVYEPEDWDKYENEQLKEID